MPRQWCSLTKPLYYWSFNARLLILCNSNSSCSCFSINKTCQDRVEYILSHDTVPSSNIKLLHQSDIMGEKNLLQILMPEFSNVSCICSYHPKWVTFLDILTRTGIVGQMSWTWLEFQSATTPILNAFIVYQDYVKGFMLAGLKRHQINDLLFFIFLLYNTIRWMLNSLSLYVQSKMLSFGSNLL